MLLSCMFTVLDGELPRACHRVVLTALCAAALAFAGAASAQEQTPDAFEESLLQYRSFFDYGGFEPDLESILPKGAVSRWTPHAGIEATYSDNVDKDDRDKDAFWSDGVLGLGWVRQSPRFTGSADYRYSVPLYESNNATDRDSANHRFAGSMRWQATEHLKFSGGGHLAQDLEGGLAVATPGLPSTYGNRSDEYGANVGYDWRIGRTATNRGSYRFTMVDYVSQTAGGNDVRRHNASEVLGFALGGRDRMDVSYAYGAEEELDTDSLRQNHSGGATWTHQILSFPSRDSSELNASYRFQRVVYSGTDDDSYWDHAGTLGYRFRPGARTRLGVNGGYQVIRPDAGNDSSGWNAGADLEHQFGLFTTASADVSRHLVYDPDENGVRDTISYQVRIDHQFTEYTRGGARVSQSWEYLPTSSTSNTTDLTRSLHATVSLNSRLAERVNGSLRAGYQLADQRAASGLDNDYWQATVAADLTSKVSPDLFLGTGYSFERRLTDESTDDYRLQKARVFCRWVLQEWLSAKVQYSYETRGYDSNAAAGSDYDENRVFGSMTATW